MKKIVAAILTFLLLLFGLSVYAKEWEQEITVTYNGELIPFNIEPQIINDRTMVPFRAVFERFGGTVSFDAATRTVSSVKDGKTLSFVIGEYEATIKEGDGEEKIAIDTPPVIVDNYTLVPVRFVAEASGFKVHWDEFYREVVIINTDEWKDLIKKRASSFDKLMNIPVKNLIPGVAAEAEEDLEIKLGVNLSNLRELFTDIKDGPQNADFSLDVKIKNDKNFDGENVASQSHLTLDLSSLNSFLKKTAGENLTEEEKTKIDKVFKWHNINLEVITDKDYNVYIKGKDFIDLIKVLFGDEINELIAYDYLIIPPSAIREPLTNEANTLWEVIDVLCDSADNLITEDIKEIDIIFEVLSQIFSDENVKTTKKADGSEEIVINITKDDFMSAMENMIATIWKYEHVDSLNEAEKAYVEAQMQEMRAFFDAIGFEMKGNILIKDSVIKKSSISTYAKMTNYLVPETNNSRFGFDFKMTSKSAFKELAEIRKITVPKKLTDRVE